MVENVGSNDVRADRLGVGSLPTRRLVNVSGFTVHKTMDTLTNPRAVGIVTFKSAETDELGTDVLDANLAGFDMSELHFGPVGFDAFIDVFEESIEGGLETSGIGEVRGGVHYEKEGNRLFLKNKIYFEDF